MPGLLVVMGSGETAPTMVKPHRSIFERVGDRSAVLLDTPYGFQSNADDISTRAVGYFAASVGRDVHVVSWRGEPQGLARERALADLREAGWVFAGPGSPTYALRQWRDTPVPTAFVDVLSRDGVVVFASAAALTLGSHTVPVYEIYKAGLDPHWVEGLNLVEKATGMPAIVIPHYNNAEGGHHDTRFCYLGENRLSAMERELPSESFIIGVDEHTAVLFDCDARMATVVGNGTITMRRRGSDVVHAAGSVVDFDGLLSGVAPKVAAASKKASASAPEDPEPAAEPEGAAATSLAGAAEEIAARFGKALDKHDVDDCVACVLDLEQVLLDWSADTLTSDEGDRARGHLRTMMLRLGDLAIDGTRDTRDIVQPFVDGLLELRRRARDAKDFATSDWVRDRLTEAGVEVRDTPDGAEWHLQKTN